MKFVYSVSLLSLLSTTTEALKVATIPVPTPPESTPAPPESTPAPPPPSPPPCTRVEINNFECFSLDSDASISFSLRTSCPNPTDSFCIAGQFLPIAAFANQYECNENGPFSGVSAYLPGPGRSCTDFIGDVSEIFICPAGVTICPSGSRRFLLTAAKNYTEHAQEEMEVQQQCGPELYQTWLYITDHVYLVATPVESQKHCPSAVVHAVFDEKEGQAHKEVLLFPTSSELQQEFSLDDNALPIRNGQYALQELIQAVRQVPIANPHYNGHEYHILYNNCAHLALNMAQHLKIKVSDAAIRSFVLQQLTRHASNSIMERARDTFSSLFSTPHSRQLRSSAAAVVDDDDRMLKVLMDKTLADFERTKA